MWSSVCLVAHYYVHVRERVKLLGAGVVVANSLVVHAEHWLPPLEGAKATLPGSLPSGLWGALPPSPFSGPIGKAVS